MSIINFKEFFTQEHNGFLYEEKKYLLEINYGALETDNRIIIIRDLIKSNILKSLNEMDLKGHSRINTNNKLKDSINAHLEWSIYTSEARDRTNGICTDASVTNIDNKKFNLNELKEFFTSSKSDVYISHEVKHMLDDIDMIHKKEYIKPSEETASQYLSQDRERHNFFISVMEDLKRIKEENPKIELEQALKNLYGILKLKNIYHPNT